MDNKLCLKKRRRNKKNRKKVLLRCCVKVITVIAITTVAIRFFILNNKNTLVSAEAQDSLGNGIITNEEATNDDNCDNKLKELDNSGYLLLEDDPNAEDALYVFKNTEGLLKGTKTYPVREDGKKVVYLTFDDGPSTENTNDVLEILDEYGIKATFFVTGTSIDNGEESKELLKKIAKNGHAIGNHSYSHDYNKLYPGRVIDADAFMKDIDKNNDAMKKVLGKDFSTRVIRFPGGYWSWNGRSEIRPILDDIGYAIIDWNSLSEDAQGSAKNAEQLVERTKVNMNALGENADSVVFLMHDTYGKKETAKALPEIIEYFESKGFEFKTIK